MLSYTGIGRQFHWQDPDATMLHLHREHVAGYAPLMPTFQGQVSEEQLAQIIAYIKSLNSKASATSGTN